MWRILRSFLRFLSNSCTSPSKLNFEIYPALTGIKTPTSKFSGSK
ncbi:ArsR family transcriptional regulator, partial [Bacillus wiedmannii]